MENFVIAITRTSGSGATSIGRILAKNLGVELYDRNLLRLASDDSGISQELFARADEDQKQSLLFRVSSGERGFHIEQQPVQLSGQGSSGAGGCVLVCGHRPGRRLRAAG